MFCQVVARKSSKLNSIRKLTTLIAYHTLAEYLYSPIPQIQLLSQAMPPTGPNGLAQSSEPVSSVSQVNTHTHTALTGEHMHTHTQVSQVNTHTQVSQVNTSPSKVFSNLTPRCSSAVGDPSKGSGHRAVSAYRRQSEIFARLCRCFYKPSLFVDSLLILTSSSLQLAACLVTFSCTSYQKHINM